MRFRPRQADPAPRGLPSTISSARPSSGRGAGGLRVCDRSPARGALRSPELLQRGQARGQGHGVHSPGCHRWSDKPTAGWPRSRGGRAAQQQHQLMPSPGLTCDCACAERSCRSEAWEPALRMRPSSVVLKRGSTAAVLCSPIYLGLCRLEGKKWSPTPCKI